MLPSGNEQSSTEKLQQPDPSWTVAILQVEVRQWHIQSLIRQAALQSIDPVARANAAVRDFGAQSNKKRGKGKTEPLSRVSYNVQRRRREQLGVNPTVPRPAAGSCRASRIRAAFA